MRSRSMREGGRGGEENCLHSYILKNDAYRHLEFTGDAGLIGWTLSCSHTFSSDVTRLWE